jgi:Family of unknown function (DUF6092)
VNTDERAKADFELALYLVAAARDCLDEPLLYGPFRMVEGVSKLLARAGGDEFLARAKVTIDSEKYKVMGERERFAAWLDELLRDFAAEAKRRNLDRAPRRTSPGNGR